MGLLSRTKGKVWEREVAALFRAVMPSETIRRGLQSRDGSEAADVEMPFFFPECKHEKKPRPRAALEQAEEAMERGGIKGKVAIAVIKQQRKEPYVVIRLSDFLDLVGEWYQGRQR